MFFSWQFSNSSRKNLSSDTNISTQKIDIFIINTKKRRRKSPYSKIRTFPFRSRRQVQVPKKIKINKIINLKKTKIITSTKFETSMGQKKTIE